MKKLGLLLILILAAGAGALFFAYSQRQAIVSAKIQKGLESLTGMGIEMEGVHLKKPQSLSSRVLLEIAKIRIKGPSGFNQQEFAEASNVELEINFFKLLIGHWRISHLRIPINSINLEINSTAKVNLGALTALQKKTLEGIADHSFLIRKLEFQLKAVRFYDYRAVQNPQPEEYHFSGPMEIYTSVQGPAVLIQAPVLQLLYQMNKGSLGLPRDEIQEAVTKNTGKQNS